MIKVLSSLFFSILSVQFCLAFAEEENDVLILNKDIYCKKSIDIMPLTNNGSTRLLLFGNKNTIYIDEGVKYYRYNYDYAYVQDLNIEAKDSMKLCRFATVSYKIENDGYEHEATFVNCLFKNIRFLQPQYDILKFQNCVFDNCNVEICKNFTDNTNISIVEFEGCTFYNGIANTNNQEMLHCDFLGWKSLIKINNCRFIKNDKKIRSADWIDTYDAVNLSITNCDFLSESSPTPSSPLITIKSHSHAIDYSLAIDTVGYKYGISISNCTFNIYNTEPIVGSTGMIISMGDTPRPTSKDSNQFNVRQTISIHDNMFYLNGKFESTLSFFHIWDGVKDCSIMNNKFIIKSSGSEKEQFRLLYQSGIDELFGKSYIDGLHVLNNTYISENSYLCGIFRNDLDRCFENGENKNLISKNVTIKDNFFKVKGIRPYAKSLPLNISLNPSNRIIDNTFEVLSESRVYSTVCTKESRAFFCSVGCQIYDLDTDQPLWLGNDKKWYNAQKTYVEESNLVTVQNEGLVCSE